MKKRLKFVGGFIAIPSLYYLLAAGDMRPRLLYTCAVLLSAFTLAVACTALGLAAEEI